MFVIINYIVKVFGNIYEVWKYREMIKLQGITRFFQKVVLFFR